MFLIDKVVFNSRELFVLLEIINFTNWVLYFVIFFFENLKIFIFVNQIVKIFIE